jgi:hypothetical protein
MEYATVSKVSGNYIVRAVTRAETCSDKVH